MFEGIDPSMFLTLVMLSLYTAAFLVFRYLFERGLRKLAIKQNVGELGVAFALRSLNTVLFVAYGLLVLGVFGLDFSDVEVLLSSVFAVVGVAFFAQWSILSNITASSIIFFSFPYRVGDWVQVVEKDIDVVGLIEDISLFHVLIRNARGELITYPNNLILQKPVLRFNEKPQDQLPSTMSEELVPFNVGQKVRVETLDQVTEGSITHKNLQRIVLSDDDGKLCVLPTQRLQRSIITLLS
ncbi:mechanosensitive ion channel family protein [Simiduia curdlanivorans]|uniref:Small-conductance mechanosensitive channel n=1 Tax=Simiduia curdlanivorans TaxID=1492769 RepID=A0ABV8V6M1_9GAMM|nr:mechanosensitive ion channel family protein [Simiduia curdlanivorans]MDN3638878.1 mechanosensitive ion channel family protein [Simiduia curdlanivorans]